jgi:hypothetical protein
MSNWSPPPASLPAWAQKQDDDDQKVKDVKQLLSVTTSRMRETHSEFLAKKRYSEELERYVKDMQKEIDTLKEEIKHNNELINMQRAHIHSLSILMPKKRKRPAAAYCVYVREIRSGATWPTRVESTVMTTSAPTAPVQMIRREWRIAIIAAMKNVRSPISVARITAKASPNALEKAANEKLDNELSDGFSADSDASWACALPSNTSSAIRGTAEVHTSIATMTCSHTKHAQHNA